MKVRIVKTGAGMVKTIPDVFNIAPDTDYNRYISHSVWELATKTGDRTAKQMTRAIASVVKKNPALATK